MRDNKAKALRLRAEAHKKMLKDKMSVVLSLPQDGSFDALLDDLGILARKDRN